MFFAANTFAMMDAALNDCFMGGTSVYNYDGNVQYCLEIDFPYHFDFTWTSEYRTKIYGDRANRVEQPAVDLHHLSLGYNPFDKTRLVFSLRNITDETYRSAYTPFPTPGREYKLTLTQGF